MKKLLKIFLGLSAITLLILSWTAFRIIRTGQFDQAANADAIVVLGAAEYAGKPSPVFQARLDHAKNLFEKNLAPLIITTGGIHPGEKISEGEAGKNYLISQDVPAEKIIAEIKSLTTKENLNGVKEIAARRNIKTIIIVSDAFHLYRAKKIAENLNLIGLTSPATNSPISKNTWLELKYIGREIALVLMQP
ncbi:YdcF family protein [Candidatus Peregrinibacteria bacterium]|nr:YdcF family protein [Candidatus Peregrinibacteria bacterium]